MTNKQPIHRYTANSKQGRKIASNTAPSYVGLATLSKEQQEWNARVEANKKAKKEQSK